MKNKLISFYVIIQVSFMFDNPRAAYFVSNAASNDKDERFQSSWSTSLVAV